MVALIILLIAGAAVLVIALVSVGRAVGQLEALDAPVVLRVEDAVDWIADQLPAETTARLSYDDVELVVEAHLAWFDAQGLSTEYGEELAADAGDADIVAPVDDAHDFVVAMLADLDLDVDPVDAVQVVALHTAYLDRIGAFGDDEDRT